MMGTGKFANAKGKRGEREVVRLLQPIVTAVYEERGLTPPVMFRNQNQSANGGYDIDGISWLALEVKRCETLQINKWWKQCTSQGNKDQVPVLIYKQNRQPWKVIMYGYMQVEQSCRIKARIQVDLDTFLLYFKTKIERRLEEGDISDVAK